MTFFRRLITWKRWPSWIWIPALVFLGFWVNGCLLGLSDDEAYYWVLAQRPALGYAFHPPGMAWLITLTHWTLGWALDQHRAALVRFPAALCMSVVFGLALAWMEAAGASRERLSRSALTLLSFAGFTALAWMMVPDTPLFLGWMIAFYSTWILCFAEDSRFRVSQYAWLTVGVTIAMLGKYSGVLAAGSAGLCVLFWAPPARRWKGVLAIVTGACLAAIPILIWNSSHQWASLLYQVRDRHEGASLSLVRYARFWGIELLAAGPPLILYFFLVLRRSLAREARVFRYVAAWMLPGALVFCVQPLWTDFKPHWAFIVWWPVAMALGWASSQTPRDRALAKAQAIYGIPLAAFAILSMHVPISGWIMRTFAGHDVDPRLDVSNDLYGWEEFPEFLDAKLGLGKNRPPVIGSRYQTASQAAVALGDNQRTTLLPRDIKALDEWPSVGVSDSEGPSWPRLKAPVLFVGDNRYDAPPEFPGADCRRLGSLEKSRWGHPAKRIDLWRCEPGGPRP